MTTFAEPMLNRLDGLRQTGPDRYLAKCPAHTDRSPSLSIRVTPGRILIHCFAGCATQDVLAAVELSFRDLYPDKWEAARHAATAQRKRLEPVSEVELDRTILQLAQVFMERGETLALEDRARVELALERSRG